MRLTRRDAVATGLTAGVVALYAAFVRGAYLPAMSSPRAVAAAVLALGFLACNIGAPDAFGSGAKRWTTVVGSVLGVTTLLAGTVTLISGFRPALAVLVTATVALWAFTTARHTFAGRRPEHTEPPLADVLVELHKDQLPPRVSAP